MLARNARRATRGDADPGVPAGGAASERSALLADLKAFGLLFEWMVVRDARVYAPPRDGEVHYRDQSVQFALSCAGSALSAPAAGT